MFSKNFTTRLQLTMGQMTMFVVKSVSININGHGYGSINLSTTMSCHIVVHCHKLTGDTSTPLLTLSLIIIIRK